MISSKSTAPSEQRYYTDLSASSLKKEDIIKGLNFKPLWLTGFIDGSISNQKRFYKIAAHNIPKNEIPSELKSILIGLLLGDLYCQKSTPNSNCRLRFEQGIVHKDYLNHLYNLFSNFCSSEPKINQRLPDKRTGKIYSNIYFNTMTLPIFNEFHELFYPDGIKIVPKNIENLLTVPGLAYWAMDDGMKFENGFVFCTDSCTLEEVRLLVKVLQNKFGLKCGSKIRKKDVYRIYIWKESMNKFIDLIQPHFHESMLYKLK
jgi:hypothetical protein